MYFIIPISITILIVCSMAFVSFLKLDDRLKRKDLFLRFNEILAIYETSQELAYEKLFRNDILIHSTSGYRINKEEMDKFQREYVELVFKSCGPNIVDDLEKIYGDLDSLTLSLINDFIKKVGQDELVLTEALKNQQLSDLDSDKNEV